MYDGYPTQVAYSSTVVRSQVCKNKYISSQVFFLFLKYPWSTAYSLIEFPTGPFKWMRGTSIASNQIIRNNTFFASTEKNIMFNLYISVFEQLCEYVGQRCFATDLHIGLVKKTMRKGEQLVTSKRRRCGETDLRISRRQEQRELSTLCICTQCICKPQVHIN